MCIVLNAIVVSRQYDGCKLLAIRRKLVVLDDINVPRSSIPDREFTPHPKGDVTIGNSNTILIANARIGFDQCNVLSFRCTRRHYMISARTALRG